VRLQEIRLQFKLAMDLGILVGGLGSGLVAASFVAASFVAASFVAAGIVIGGFVEFSVQVVLDSAWMANSRRIRPNGVVREAPFTLPVV